MSLKFARDRYTKTSMEAHLLKAEEELRNAQNSRYESDRGKYTTLALAHMVNALKVLAKINVTSTPSVTTTVPFVPVKPPSTSLVVDDVEGDDAVY